MTLTLESYAAQEQRWPREGTVILAQYDAHSLHRRYQAFHAVTAPYEVKSPAARRALGLVDG